MQTPVLGEQASVRGALEDTAAVHVRLGREARRARRLRLGLRNVSRTLQRSHQATAIGSFTIHESDAIQGERLGKAVRFHSRSLARRSAGGRAALGKVVFL